jgi:hypothetical protein
LLYLLLQRHKKIVELAQTTVLSEQEFEVMFASVNNIAEAFRHRFNTLLECWRQQRIDTKLQLSCFAGGMFENWHEEFYDPVCLVSR